MGFIGFFLQSAILGSSIGFWWIFGYLSPFIIACIILLGSIWFQNHHDVFGSQDAVVITGCDSGLGYSLAIHCHKNLHIPVIAAIHRSDSLGTKELIKMGITVHPLDITNKESIQTFVKWTNCYLKENNFTLRSVINNAAIMVFGEFEWQTYEQIYRQINVNLIGTMSLTKDMIPLMRKYHSRLIIVTSHCAIEALPGVSVYGATKAALSAWVTSLRVELKRFNIKVVNFIPGSFIGESNLLSQQQKYFNDMESAMTSEIKQLYSEYFRRYADYLSPLSENFPPRKVNNRQLYKIFDNALLHHYPNSIYKCEPWRYMFYHLSFRIAPTNIRDWLVVKFMQMPAWEECKQDKLF